MVPVSTIMAKSSIVANRLRNLPTLLVYMFLLGFSDCAPAPSPLDVPVTNVTPLATHDPDPRFKLLPHYTNERLPATAVLMSTVYLLAEAADLDINSELVFDNPSIFDDYPSVSISLQNAKPTAILPVSFLVWGLYEAAMDMINNFKFTVSTFDILWKGKIVAWLRYHKVPPNASSGNPANRDVSLQVSVPSNYSSIVVGNRSNFAQKNKSENNTTSMTSAPNAVEPLTTASIITIHMQYLPDAKTLPIGTVFAIILETLKDNAEFSATARIPSSSFTLPAFDVTLVIRGNRGPSMRTPPYFEYAYLNRAIRQIPRLMLSEGKIAEVTFQIEVDDKEYV